MNSWSPWKMAAAVVAMPALALIAQGCGDSQEPVAQAPPPQPAAVGKKPAAVGTTPKPKPASAGQPQRRASEGDLIPLTVLNKTGSPVRLEVDAEKNRYWESPRPDHGSPEGFQNVTVGSVEVTRALGPNQRYFPEKVFFKMRFVIGGDQDPPTVRLQGKGPRDYSASTCEAGRTCVWYRDGWGSAETGEEDCDAVTKPFPDDGIKVTMDCSIRDRSIVTIEKM